MTDFNIEEMQKDFKKLCTDLESNTDLKRDPRNTNDYITYLIRKLPVVLKSIDLLQNIATVDLNQNIVTITPRAKDCIKPIETALSSLYQSQLIIGINKNAGAIEVTLPPATQDCIDIIVAKFIKPIKQIYSHKIKDIREKWQKTIKPMQTKQLEMYKKHSKQIDDETKKCTESIDKTMSNLAKKFQITI